MSIVFHHDPATDESIAVWTWDDPFWLDCMRWSARTVRDFIDTYGKGEARRILAGADITGPHRECLMTGWEGEA